MKTAKAFFADEFQPLAAAVRQTSSKGRAVYALTNILKHSVILQSQAVLLNAEDYEKLGETGIWPYRFALRDQCAFVFGDIAFCNHSDTPNATISWTRLTPTTAIANLIALTDIKANADIEILYADTEEYRRRGVILS